MKRNRDARRIRELKEAGHLLDHEGGTQFYHRALSPRARAHKRARRRMARESRRRNR